MTDDMIQDTIFEKTKRYVVNIRDLERENSKRLNQSPVEVIQQHVEQDFCKEIKSDEEKLNSLLKEDYIYTAGTDSKKIKLEATLLYYSINSDLVKIERSLRDTKSIRMVLVQRYDRAKENLALHDKILANQSNDARNYYGILYAIYDSVEKYTLPSARIITDLSNLQSEIEMNGTKELKLKDKSLMELITDSLQKLSINLPKNMTKNLSSKDITKLFEEMASFIEQNRTKYLNFEKKARDIFDISLYQRDQIQKDIVVILQNISEINEKIIQIEKDYNKVKDNMVQLLEYMREKLGIDTNGDASLLCEDDATI